MDDHGRLKVNQYLQVEGHEDIFAMGDCTNLKETKLAYLALQHAKTILGSLKLRAKNKALKKYTPGTPDWLGSISSLTTKVSWKLPVNRNI